MKTKTLIQEVKKMLYSEFEGAVTKVIKEMIEKEKKDHKKEEAKMSKDKKEVNIFTKEAEEIIRKSEDLNQAIDESLEEYSEVISKGKKITEKLVKKIMKAVSTYEDVEKAYDLVRTKLIDGDLGDYGSREFVRRLFDDELAKCKIEYPQE